MAYAVQVRKYFKTSRNIFRKLENKYDSEIYIYIYIYINRGIPYYIKSLYIYQQNTL